MTDKEETKNCFCPWNETIKKWTGILEQNSCVPPGPPPIQFTILFTWLRTAQLLERKRRQCGLIPMMFSVIRPIVSAEENHNSDSKSIQG